MFGVALDASDDPMNLELKRACMIRGNAGNSASYADPYDALAGTAAECHGVELAGKVPIPSWLGSRPSPSELCAVDPEHFRRFYEGKGFLRMSQKVCGFVKEHIFPDYPVMIGIDHSTTGGVVSALSDRYGAENLGVIILDRHFDAISLSERMSTNLPPDGNVRFMPPGMMPFSTVGAEEYCCGSFWAHLLDGGVVLPQNLLFIGVADYPDQHAGPRWRRFRESYLNFEKRGCHFFRLRQFEGPYIDSLAQCLHEFVKAPYLYVSLDVDVGSLDCVHAARYMDGPGISRENLLDIASLIAAKVRSGTPSLVGVDIMEFNMHFLGIQTHDGLKDRTLDVVHEFMDTLLPCMAGAGH